MLVYVSDCISPVVALRPFKIALVAVEQRDTGAEAPFPVYGYRAVLDKRAVIIPFPEMAAGTRLILWRACMDR